MYVFLSLQGAEPHDMCYTPGVLKEEWTLIAINASGAHGLSPVQLQKSLFLFGKEFAAAIGPFYDFVPHNYGPFSKEVYADADRLAQQELVSIRKPPGVSFATYSITPEGRDRAVVLEKRAPAAASAYLHKVVNWACQLSFSQLVRAIYAKYPEFRINSVFEG